MSGPASPGCSDAARMADAKRRGLLCRPDDSDAPPPSLFPGRETAVLPGQLALGEAGDLDEDLDTEAA